MNDDIKAFLIIAGCGLIIILTCIIAGCTTTTPVNETNDAR